MTNRPSPGQTVRYTRDGGIVSVIKTERGKSTEVARGENFPKSEQNDYEKWGKLSEKLEVSSHFDLTFLE